MVNESCQLLPVDGERPHGVASEVGRAAERERDYLLFTIHHSRSLDLPVEPGLRHAPLALDRRGADAEDFGRLLHGESAEESKLDNLHLLRVYLGEEVQGVVSGDEVHVALARNVYVLVERELLELAAALLGLVRARVVYEYAAHHLRGDAEEVRAVLPLNLRLVYEAHVSLVYERRGLQGVPDALAPQVARRELAKLAVDDGQKLVEDAAVAIRQANEEPRHVLL